MKHKTMFFIIFLAVMICSCLIFCSFHIAYWIGSTGENFYLRLYDEFLDINDYSVIFMIIGLVGMMVTALIPNKMPKFLKKKDQRKTDESEKKE